MREIQVLDKNTIDKIAAGEVVERPASVVKELTENAIDARATAITIEIRDGGTTFMRITDNGGGIPADQVKRAFLRHATSKIRKAEDLLSISSLGFRGEALSSISAVSQMECITKTPEALTGIRYCIEGGEEKDFEEIGAPTGTTFIVRNLFFNVPARAKFLKSAASETNHVANYVEELALSHPDISFKFIVNGQNRLYTGGNGNLKEIVYQIFGRDLTKEMIPIHGKSELMEISGFIGSPNVARGNRNFENYFVNGRYVKSKLIAKSIEDAYHGFLMSHKYPFTLLYLNIDSTKVDVNVHPQKMELRFSDQENIYHELCLAIQNALMNRNQIPEMPVKEQGRNTVSSGRLPVLPKGAPEPFERQRRQEQMPLKPERGAFSSMEGKLAARDTSYRAPAVQPSSLRETTTYTPKNYSGYATGSIFDAYEQTSKASDNSAADIRTETSADSNTANADNTGSESKAADNGAINAAADNGVVHAAADNSAVHAAADNGVISAAEDQGAMRTAIDKETSTNDAESAMTSQQLSLFEEDQFLSDQARRMFRIIGQLFNTYWLIEYKESLYIIDQHAAHEKVNYERMMKNFHEKKVNSQNLMPAIILDLSNREAELIRKHLAVFNGLGYEIEHFGGRSWKISAVPANLYSVASDRLFLDILDQLDEMGELNPAVIPQKLASMSCKAAVKGNSQMSIQEVNALIDELLTLDDPYHCPHGRPTIISMSRYEMDKKFKRIV